MAKFPKAFKLCSKKEIEHVINNGNTFTVFPLRIIWNYSLEKSDIYCKIAFSVGKKRFKHATDRNRLKRQLREAYRLNYTPFYQKLKNSQINISVLVIYTHTRKIFFNKLNQSTIQYITKIQNELPKQ